MIKVSVFYHNEADKNFDMAYYCEQHIPLVKQCLGDALKNVAVEQGIAGMMPDGPAAYTAMGHLYFDSIEDFQTAFASHAAAILGDVPNFTNGNFSVQISEVKI
ncbi:MAG: EthD family reductase [Saprospiraceae bacterium]